MTLRTDRTGAVVSYASPVDYDKYSEYGPGRGFDREQRFQRPRYRFRGRITADGSSGYRAEPGRYHLYISWGCPWAQRTAIVRQFKRLERAVSLSYVDDTRDGRGWAFRERRGPDPVNGFSLLAEAYEATEPGYDGHVSVPVLWDRVTRRIVSNNFPDLTIDLGTAFEAWADTSVDLYPQPLRREIDELNEQVYSRAGPGHHSCTTGPGESRSSHTWLTGTLLKREGEPLLHPDSMAGPTLSQFPGLRQHRRAGDACLRACIDITCEFSTR